jgi:hypothetical protein
MIDWLNYFGITPNQLGPAIIVGAMYSLAAWKFFLKGILQDMKYMKYEITDLHHATREIQKYLEDDDAGWTPQHRLGTNPTFPTYGTASNPAVPNIKGAKLLEDSKFNEQYPKCKDKLFASMDGMRLRTLYDYEKGAVRALRRLRDDPLFDPIKEHSVNHPNEPLSVIFTVASWIIRDDYGEYKKEKAGQE